MERSRVPMPASSKAPLTAEGANIYAGWQVAVFNVNDVLILPLGLATSEGTRIR